MSQPNPIQPTRYANHILECAAIAKQVGERLGLRDDAAKQACFATVCIDAKGHGVFLEPVPPDSKTPVKQMAPVVTGNGATAHVSEPVTDSAARDEAAARKADAQVKDIVPNPTAEQEDGARRTAFLKGIESARSLLNKNGHVPPITPAGLNAYIAKQFSGKTNLGALDTDELERLTMLLASKLDVQREKNAKPATTGTTAEAAGF